MLGAAVGDAFSVDTCAASRWAISSHRSEENLASPKETVTSQESFAFPARWKPVDCNQGTVAEFADCFITDCNSSSS